MDDKTFDFAIANQWINTIESPAAQVREADIYPRLQSWMAHATPKTVLDIGCGQGVCSEKIAFSDEQYAGTDPSEALILRAKQLYPTRQFVVGSAYALPFSDRAFDAAFSVAVWHLLANLALAAAELSRVLQTGGHFFIITANPSAYAQWTAAYFDAQTVGRRFTGKLRLPNNMLTEDTLYLHTLEELEHSLQSVNLQLNEKATFRVSATGVDMYLALSGKKS